MPSRIYGRASFLAKCLKEGKEKRTFNNHLVLLIISNTKKGENFSAFSFNFFSLPIAIGITLSSLTFITQPIHHHITLMRLKPFRQFYIWYQHIIQTNCFSAFITNKMHMVIMMMTFCTFMLA